MHRLLLCLCLALAGLRPGQDSSPTDAPAQGDVASLRLTLIQPLEIFRPTVLAGDIHGAALAWQDDTGAPDGGRVWRAEPGLAGARQTPLSPRRVAEAVAGADDQDTQLGRFDGLAIDGDDILFLWRGRLADRTRVALGRYIAAGDRVQLDVDDRTLADAAGIEGSLVLSETRLLRSGEHLWTLVRDLDRAALFRRTLGGYGLGAPVALRLPPGARAPGTLPDLRQSRTAIAAGPGGGLILTEHSAGVVWQVAPDGTTRRLAQLGRFPLAHSPAVSPEGRESVVLFAGNSGRREDGEPLVDAGLGYPALITLEPDGVARHAGRHRILAPPGFPVAALHVERLVPAGEGVLLGYDRTTGAWFRLALEAGPDVP